MGEAGAGAGKGDVSGLPGFAWGRLAGVSLLANVLLIFALLWLRPASKPGSDEEKDVLVFVDRYFSSWSAQDIDGYAACFHPQATIYFVGPGGETQVQPLRPFIDGQRYVHENAAEPMKEVPLSSEVSLDAGVARVLTRWKLTKGNKAETGTDYFTLLKSPSGWRIINLVFNKDPSK